MQGQPFLVQGERTRGWRVGQLRQRQRRQEAFTQSTVGVEKFSDILMLKFDRRYLWVGGRGEKRERERVREWGVEAAYLI